MPSWDKQVNIFAVCYQVMILGGIGELYLISRVLFYSCVERSLIYWIFFIRSPKKEEQVWISRIIIPTLHRSVLGYLPLCWSCYVGTNVGIGVATFVTGMFMLPTAHRRENSDIETVLSNQWCMVQPNGVTSTIHITTFCAARVIKMTSPKSKY